MVSKVATALAYTRISIARGVAAGAFGIVMAVLRRSGTADASFSVLLLLCYSWLTNGAVEIGAPAYRLLKQNGIRAPCRRFQ